MSKMYLPVEHLGVLALVELFQIEFLSPFAFNLLVVESWLLEKMADDVPR